MKAITSDHHQKTFSLRLLVPAILCAVLATFFGSGELFAKAPPNFHIQPFDLPDVESSGAEATTVPDSAQTSHQVIVDTDAGVDDAAALIWLFSQSRFNVEVTGIATVAGATNVDQAVNNVNLVLQWVGQDVPVIRGAAAPLVQSPSFVPALIHGPDGLWFTNAPVAQPDSSNATEFYCQALKPGMLVIATGPLTNIAKAMDSSSGGCPSQWNGVELISLGGSIHSPNQTPVAEYNYWQDPEAVAKVLAVGPANHTTIQIVLGDAFNQFQISTHDLNRLGHQGNGAILNLLPALTAYVGALSQGTNVPVALPDPTVMIYALNNGFGTAQSALVEVLAGSGIPEVARGETIVGLSLNDRITMIASDAVLSQIAQEVFSDPNFDVNAALGAILASEPDNASVVTDIDARRMHNVFMQDVSANNVGEMSESAQGIEQGGLNTQIYVPFVTN